MLLHTCCADCCLKFYIPPQICSHLKTKGFYKQNYCGCCYSLVERLEEKFRWQFPKTGFDTENLRKKLLASGQIKQLL